MSSKTKSSLSENANNKPTPATPTPRVSKVTRGVTKSDTNSPSPLPNPRLSIDRSPRSVTSKPSVERRSPKLTPPPEKQTTRVLKGSELQAQLSLAQEDLKKAKEKLVSVEKEKEQAVDELKVAQRLAEEANEKLREAVVAQKRAEESSEIEKFRAVEMEQAGIEATQKKEEEWKKELEEVRNQHAVDVAALLSATQELQKVKQELVKTCDAKKQALSHADDATKIAEVHAEKVEILSAEVVRLKTLLDSKLDTEVSENNKLVAELNIEIESLKKELEDAKSFEEKLVEKEASLEQLNVELEAARMAESYSRNSAKSFEEKLVEKEASLEQLNVELEAARMAESYARSLVEEWQQRVEELEHESEEASRLERSASESLESVMKQLEGSNDLLHDAESEIASLKEKVGLLEISIGRQKGDMEESVRRLNAANEEASEMAKQVKYLQSELETVKEEKNQALHNEKLAAASVQTLLEEKNKLINELENSRDEEDKSKKAMESLASALHEVSSEAREAKEKLLSSQAEYRNYESQIEDLNLVLKATKEKYETMIEDSNHEIDVLTNLIEQSKLDYQNSKSEWEKKELYLANSMKQSEEENSAMESEIKELLHLVKVAKEEASAAKEEGSQLKNTLKEAESEVNYLKEVLGEAKAESMRLKESLLDKENELQNILQENQELRTREAASLEKVEELSKLIEEAKTKNQAEENGDLTDSEKDYDMLPKVVEFSERNGNGEEENLKLELPPPQCEPTTEENHQEENADLRFEAVQIATAKVEDLNGKTEESESKVKEEDDAVEVDYKMWESCKIEEKDFSPERGHEQESVDEEVHSKLESSESFDQLNGLSSTENVDHGETSPSSAQQSQKKKKPLLRKFGNLLKKKSTNSQK